MIPAHRASAGGSDSSYKRLFSRRYIKNGRLPLGGHAQIQEAATRSCSLGGYRQAAIGVSRFIVEHRWQLTLTHRKRASDQLDHGAPCAEIAEVTLQRSYRHVTGPSAKYFLNRTRFIGIAIRRAQAVRVDMANIRRRLARITKSCLHRSL